MCNAFDLAHEVDLVAVERALRSRRTPLGGVARLHLERQQDAIVIANTPVTMRLGDRALRIGEHEFRAGVYARFYAFGALTVVWTVPLPASCSLDDLATLAVELATPSSAAALDAWARDDAIEALAAAAAAVADRIPHEPLERLVLHAIRTFRDDVTATQVLDHPSLAPLVLGERLDFSPTVLADLRDASASYTTHDLVVVGYDQALIYDAHNAGDIAALLEFALVQVHELDWYDLQLDARLSAASAAVGVAHGRSLRRRATGGFGSAPFERLRKELLVEHMELVRVLEQVTAAVKVTDDLYYASIYHDAMRVFRADELIEATNRKLELVFRTYSMLGEEADSQTSHRLEWIIIVLILFEIVMSLFDRAF